MVRLDVVPDADRRVIRLQLTELPDQLLSYIDLTPDMLQATFAKLLAAWLVVDEKAGVPGAPGTWTNRPAIEGPDWRVATRPMDGAVIFSFCPDSRGGQELWLTYALQRQQAESLVRIAGGALARPIQQGRA